MSHQPADALIDSYAAAKRIGRPHTLTSTLLDSLGALIAEGTYPDVARGCLGIPKSTFYYWKKLGKEQQTQGIDDSPEVRLLDLIEKAECWAEHSLMYDGKQGKMGWQAPITVLSRRFRERWQDKVESESGPKVIVMLGVQAGDVTVQIAHGEQAKPDLRLSLSPCIEGESLPVND